MYILLSAFAFNTVCGVLPRLGRGFGPPATDSPDWAGIVTANFKIRSLQVNLHCVTSNSIGQSIRDSGWRRCALWFWLVHRSLDLARISEDRRIDSH